MKLTWKQGRWIGLWLANLALIKIVWASLSLKMIGAGYAPTLMAFSRLAALLAAYTVLVQLWLIGRGRWLERDFGLDRLTRIHRWNGFAAVVLVVMHVSSLVAAQSSILGLQPPATFQYILANYEDTSKAFIAEICLFVIAFSSLVIARRKLKYEYWYYIHLLTYIVVLFSFGHQVKNGLHILTFDWFNVYWYALFALTLGSLILYRFIRPFWLWNKHQFRVARVEAESDSAVSIYLSGRNIADFNYEAGQFAKFWFVAKGYWLEEHPFSMSREPGSDELRITPKAIGDFTTKLRNIPKGVPVVVDGPYGRFTPAIASHKKLVFIAGGIGITPIRAMLGALAKSKDKRTMTLYYSARQPKDLVFKTELEKISKDLSLTIVYIVTEGELKGARKDMLTIESVRSDIKQLSHTDFFICGPPPMMAALRKDLMAQGVKSEDIHYEQFSLVKS
ncbi:MAG: ferredoxin reductase family protein [bacterium]